MTVYPLCAIRAQFQLMFPGQWSNMPYEVVEDFAKKFKAAGDEPTSLALRWLVDNKKWPDIGFFYKRDDIGVMDYYIGTIPADVFDLMVSPFVDTVNMRARRSPSNYVAVMDFVQAFKQAGEL